VSPGNLALAVGLYGTTALASAATAARTVVGDFVPSEGGVR
jgi:hypothetical protein